MSDNQNNTEIVLYTDTATKTNVPLLTDSSTDELQRLLNEMQVSESHEPIKLDSKWDVLLEILLTHSYNVTAHGKYEHSGDCCICLESLHNTYVLEYPCKSKENDDIHAFHRNCIMHHIISEVNKIALFTNAEKCPLCRNILFKQ